MAGRLLAFMLAAARTERPCDEGECEACRECECRRSWSDLFHRGNPQRFVKAEGKHCLYRHTDGAALRQDLGERARAGARTSSNGRTLTAAGDGADDCAKCRAAPGILRSSLVCSQIFPFG